MPRLTKPIVDYEMDELVQALSRLAILPTLAVEEEKVVDSAATLPLNDITANQPEPAQCTGQDDTSNVVMEGTQDPTDTLFTTAESYTIIDDNEPQIEQFPRHSPATATVRSQHELDDTDCRIGLLKRTGQDARERLRNDGRRMQGYLGLCLRWLDHYQYIKEAKSVAVKFAAVEWLEDNLVERLRRAGYLSGALQS